MNQLRQAARLDHVTAVLLQHRPRGLRKPVRRQAGHHARPHRLRRRRQRRRRGRPLAPFDPRRIGKRKHRQRRRRGPTAFFSHGFVPVPETKIHAPKVFSRALAQEKRPSGLRPNRLQVFTPPTPRADGLRAMGLHSGWRGGADQQASRQGRPGSNTRGAPPAACDGYDRSCTGVASWPDPRTGLERPGAAPCGRRPWLQRPALEPRTADTGGEGLESEPVPCASGGRSRARRRRVCGQRSPIKYNPSKEETAYGRSQREASSYRRRGVVPPRTSPNTKKAGALLSGGGHPL